MKCTCEECNGSGRVVCLECDGTGMANVDLRVWKIPETQKHYSELVELQRDAQRVTGQAVRLRALRPNRSGSYTEQEIATLAAIQKQADKLLSGHVQQK